MSLDRHEIPFLVLILEVKKEVLILGLDINSWVIAANHCPQKTLAALGENKDSQLHSMGTEAESPELSFGRLRLK